MQYKNMQRLAIRQDGTTLLEILVSMIVIALGLLGLASLQAVSLNSNNTAYYRSQATIMAYDVLDRMRANRTAAVGSASYNINIGTPTTSVGGVAGADVNDWKRAIARSLPLGDGSILVVAGGVTTVSISWDTNSDGRVDTNDDSFTTVTTL